MSLINMEIEGLEGINEALGDLAKRSPQAAKVAINATAREGRKLMIKEVRARYALEQAGLKHVKELKQTKRATNTNLRAELRINTPRNDLAYFKHSPDSVFTGQDVFTRSPKYYKGKVLKESSLKDLSGDSDSKYSKGFLLKFKSGHVGMVQRVIGSSSKNTVTARGAPRWASKNGKIEKLRTMSSPSISAMHHIAFERVEDKLVKYFRERLDKQVQSVLERYSGRHLV